MECATFLINLVGFINYFHTSPSLFSPQHYYILLYNLVGVFIQSLFHIVLCEKDAVVLFASANALLHQLHYFQYILRKCKLE